MFNLRRFFRRSKQSAESARDLEFYIETETEENIGRGMTPQEGRAAARRKLGNATFIQEEIYRMNSLGFLEAVWQDVHYAIRTMRQSRAFALTAIFILALGIGGNTAIFSVVRAVLLKPLEYRDPDRLMHFSVDVPSKDELSLSFSQQQLDEIRAVQKSFVAVGAYGRPENITMSGVGEPEPFKGARVSANFLEILGVRPVLGRSFLREEDKRGGRPVAIISSALWKRKFGGDPNVSRKAVMIEATAYTIIGVLPDGFEFPFAGVDVWLTRPSEWSVLPPRFWDLPTLTGFGRLKSNVTLEQARAEMNVLEHQYAVTHASPMLDARALMSVVPLKERLVSNISKMLWVLFGAVGCVLLIACANVASLLLARGTSRAREFALRAALGAGRGRLVRQLLVESLLLAATGGALGLLFAEPALAALTNASALFRQSGPNALYLPGMQEIRLSGTVLGFSMVLSLCTGLLSGLFPALQVSRPNLAGMLRETGATAGRARRGIRSVLVVAQVALSIVLLIGAGLLIRSFARLTGVDPGFQPAHLLAAKVALPLAHYDTDAKKQAFFRELLPRLEQLPGIRGAAISASLPTTTWLRTNLWGVKGRPEMDASLPSSNALWQPVSPDYFRTLKIPLLRGRAFTQRDNVPGAPPVMILNETLTRHIWPDFPRGENPIGLHMGDGYDKALGWMEVVGIAADVHEGGLATGAVQEFYIPGALHPPQIAYLIVRTDGDPLRYSDGLRQAVSKVDPNQPVSDVQTVEALLNSTLGQRRLAMLLLGSFAGVALLLASIGLYGVIAYSVAQRTQEVGIRRALGAQQADILRLVLGQGLILTSLGGVLGICAAFGLTRVLRNLLFGVSATDPATFVGIGLLFILVALAASYIPARRAARIDPMEALRT